MEGQYIIIGMLWGFASAGILWWIITASNARFDRRHKVERGISDLEYDVRELKRQLQYAKSSIELLECKDDEQD